MSKNQPINETIKSIENKLNLNIKLLHKITDGEFQLSQSELTINKNSFFETADAFIIENKLSIIAEAHQPAGLICHDICLANEIFIQGPSFLYFFRDLKVDKLTITKSPVYFYFENGFNIAETNIHDIQFFQYVKDIPLEHFGVIKSPNEEVNHFLKIRNQNLSDASEFKISIKKKIFSEGYYDQFDLKQRTQFYFLIKDSKDEIIFQIPVEGKHESEVFFKSYWLSSSKVVVNLNRTYKPPSLDDFKNNFYIDFKNRTIQINNNPAENWKSYNSKYPALR